MLRGPEPSKQIGFTDRRLMLGKWRRVLEEAEISQPQTDSSELMESLAALAVVAANDDVITLPELAKPANPAALNASIMRGIHDAAQRAPIQPAAQAS